MNIPFSNFLVVFLAFIVLISMIDTISAMHVIAVSIPPPPEIFCKFEDMECDPQPQNCGIIYEPESKYGLEDECDFVDIPQPENCHLNLTICPDVDPVECPTDMGYYYPYCGPASTPPSSPSDLEYGFGDCEPGDIICNPPDPIPTDEFDEP
jgi:hypothetical protein